MSEARSPHETLQGDNRLSSRSKWRGKLLSIEGKHGRHGGDSTSSDTDVAKFLNNAVTQPRVPNHSPEPDVTHAPLATEVSPTDGGLGPPAFVDVYRRAKPRQNKGLHVAFNTAAPQVIGEGGDEAELPSRDVSASMPLTAQHELIAPDIPLSEFDNTRTGSNVTTVTTPGRRAEMRAAQLPRRPTGFDETYNVSRRNEAYEQNVTSSATSKPHPEIVNPTVQLQHWNREVPAEAQCESIIQDQKVSHGMGQETDFDDERGWHDDHQSTNERCSNVSTTSRAPSPRKPAPSSKSFPKSDPSSQGGRSQSSNHENLFVDKDPTIERKPVRANLLPNGHAVTETSAKAQIKKPSLRSIAKDIADDSLGEFDSRVRRFFGVFRLGISTHPASAGLSFAKWVKIAAWWFLEGRAILESEVRSKIGSDPQAGPSPILKQAYVNLAKAWWIIKEVTPDHPEIKRYGKTSMSSLHAVIASLGDQILAEYADVHVTIVSNMRALAMSMKRNDRLPPSELEIQRLDLHIVLENQSLPSEITTLLTNNSHESHPKGIGNISKPFFPLPIGDDPWHFHFGRMFVNVSLIDGDEMLGRSIPCIISILRDRTEWGVKIAITSQDDQISLVVSDAVHSGLPWRSVQWKIKSHEMVIQRSNELTVLIGSTEKDFKILWGIYDYTKAVKKSFSEHRDEHLVFERVLKSFHCGGASSFPSDTLAGCTLRVYEQWSEVSEGSNHKERHNGYRLAVITPANMRTLSGISHGCGRENPILLGVQHSEEGQNVFVKLLPSVFIWSLCFAVESDIDLFRHILSGTLSSRANALTASFHLRSLIITTTTRTQDANTEKPVSGTGRLHWKRLRLITSSLEQDLPGRQSRVPMGHLRILADSEFGTLTDRCYIGLGGLQLGLSVDSPTEVKISRPPQSDMTWSLADGKVHAEDLDTICRTLNDMFVSRTTRTYDFRSLTDMHSFQAIVTGFTVLYDGMVNSLAISRRRSVVPVHKRWEAISPRLQIVKQDKVVQLAAFFKDFSHGTCMNFVLKITDDFETFSKSGLFFICIVDAKFALPKGKEDESHGFLSFDSPEYPSEHDNITIGFDNELGTFLGPVPFIGGLPADMK